MKVKLLAKRIFSKKIVVDLLIFFAFALLFSYFTVSYQYRDLGIPYLVETQWERHNAVIEGESLDPWQYRVLSEVLVRGTISVLTRIGAQNPSLEGFMLCRRVQNVLIFFLFAVFLRRLGLRKYLILIGLAVLGWGMTHCLYDSDLQFNTYSDVIFYLIAGLVILYKKYLLIIPLTLLAALNRETSGLIPIMLFVDSILYRGKDKISRKGIIVVIISLIIFVCIFLGLRWYFGPRVSAIPYGNNIGSELFFFNVTRHITWLQLFVTFGIIPILSVLSIKKWPRSLKVFFVAIVPAWLLIHLFASVLAETRLLLVPYTLVFIPGALFGIETLKKEDGD